MAILPGFFLDQMTNPTHNIQGVEDKVRVQFPMVGWVVFSYWKKKGIKWQLHEFRLGSMLLLDIQNNNVDKNHDDVK